jgi:PAS domain S-box-containing protein
MRVDELVEQRDRKLLAGKQLELVYRRFTFSFWASLLVSGGLVVALWPLVRPQILLVWLLSLWLVMGARQFYAQRYLGLAQDVSIEHGKWIAGLVLGAIVAGACWGMTVLFLPATPLDAVTMMLIFVIAGVIGFASVTLAAVPLAAAAFMLPAVLPLAIWLCSFGERVYYFMGGIALTYLALMMVFSRQMYSVIRSSLSTSAQNKELAAALAQVKALEHVAAQKESEQRYRELFANFEDSIVFVDVAGDGKFSVASVNPAAERTLGVLDAEVRGKSKFDLFPADLAARLVEYDQACVESGRPLSYEEVLELPSGKRYFSVTQIPMRDESGRVYRIAAIARDITERKQMEEALATREREFRALVESAPDPIFRYDRECRRVYANQTVTRMTGIPLSKLLGQTPTATATVPSAESVKVQQSVRRVLDTGVADEVEVLFIAPDGGELSFQMLHVPEFAADGSVQGVLSMGRDITARKYMAEVLQKSEREYRALAENAPDNIVRYDRDCRIRYLNKNAEATLGIPAGYLIGKTPAEVFTDGIFDELEIAVKGVLASGQGIDFYQTLPDSGMGQRYHHLRISPERDELGVVSGVLLIGRDITERKRMEEALVVRERQFRALAENTPDPIYRYDRDCRRIYVNPAVSRISGKSAAELLGSLPTDGATLLFEQNKNLMSKIRRVFDSGEIERLDLDYTSRTGEHLDYQMLLVPERDDSGAVVTVLGIARDVTDIRSAERRLSQFVANVPGYVYTYKLHSDGSGSFPFVSPGIEEIYGVTPEEVATNVDALSAMVHPDDAVRMNELMAESARSLTPAIFEHRITHPTKGERWLELRAAPELVGDGIQWHGMTMDITERKLSEQSLEDTHWLLRSVLQGIPDPVWMKDANGAFVVCNQGVTRLFNKKEEEIIGKTDYDFFDAEMAEFYQNKDRTALEAGHVCINEEWWTFGDNGEQALMETRKVPVRGADGKLLGVLGVARDITERKQVVSHLEEARARLQTVMSTIPDMIWLKDADGVYQSCNPAFERFFGASEAEIIGKTDYDFVDAELADFFRQKDREAIEAGRICINEENIIYADDGRAGIVEARKVPVLGMDGKVIGVLGVGRDITERKAIEKAFHDSESMLQEAQRIAHVGSWDVDMVNDKLIWSDETFRIWEIDKTKFKADFAAFMETVHPEDRARVSQAYNAAVINHSLYEVEHRLLFPDGRVKHILERGEPQYDAQGKPVRFIGTSLEITERKKAENALQQSEMKFRTLYDSTGDAVMLLDEQGFFDCNDSALKTFGCATREAFCAKHPADLSPSVQLCGTDSRMLANLHIEKAMQDGSHRFEWIHRRADNNESFPAEVLLSSMELDGKPVLQATVRDITERKQAQQRMELLERAIDFSADTVFLIDEQLRFRYVNATACRSLGYSREELLAMGPCDIDPDMPRELALEMMKNSPVGETVNFETYHRTKDGRSYPVELSGVHFEDGGEKFSLSVVRDITERKRMQEELAAREFEFRSLAANLPDNIARWDVQGRYLYINPTHERLLGVAASEVLGKPLPDTHEHVKAAIAQVAATGLAVELVRQTVPVDGELQIHEVTLVPERDAAGRIVSVLGLGRNMTEFYRMQDAISAREAEFRALVEQAPEPIIRYAPDGRRIYVNAAVARITGIPVSELLDELAVSGQLVSSAQGAAVTALVLRICETGEPAEVEVENVGADGRLRYFHMRFAPEFGEDGKVRSVLSICHDITERKLAERQLKEALEFSEGVINAIPDLLFEVDRDGRYLNVWAQNPELLAAQKDLLLGNTINEVLAPEAAAISMAAIREAEKKGLSLGKTMRLDLPQGASWFELSVSKKSGGDSTAPRFLVLSRDVTERKQAEEALRESGAKLRSLYELSPLGIALTDLQGRYVEFNESFRAICGYPADELMTLDYWKLTPREYELQEIAQLESLAKTGRYGPYEKQYRQKDGTLVPIQLVGTLITGKDGQQHIWSIVEDIRERKRTEAELKERLERIVELNDHLEKTARDLEDQTVELEAQTVELEASQEQIKQTEVWYRSILHSAPDGLLVVDDHGYIMQANARLEAMFGYASGELQGHPVEVLVPHGVRPAHAGMRAEFANGNKDYREAMAARTLFGCRKDGSEFPVDVSLSRLPEIDGVRSAICASVRDVSERHAMEAAREAALAEVQHLAQLRSTFMAQMSHELRTPLNGILGYTQNLLQGEALGERQVEGLSIIQNSGEHLLTLINGLLDHAAIEADKFELIPGDIELESFLSTLIGIIRVRAEQKNLAFVCDADAGLPAVVRGDAQRLRQVLLNLLSNAVKFTDQGQVTLRVTCPAPSRLRFAVQDSGVGIASEQVDAIFLPFEQGGEISRRAGGTGLGLSISRKLVRLMGGDIKVESHPGAGSTFWFEIDMAAVESGTVTVNVAALSEQAVTRVAQAIPLLFTPPRNELDILHGSALRGNMREVIRHADYLAGLDSRYLPFVEQLRQLAKGFQTKALLSLIEQYRNEKEVEQ